MGKTSGRSFSSMVGRGSPMKALVLVDAAEGAVSSGVVMLLLLLVAAVFGDVVVVVGAT